MTFSSSPTATLVDADSQHRERVAAAYTLHHDALVEIALRILHDRDESGDVVEDIFCKVLTRNGCTCNYKYLARGVVNGALTRLRWLKIRTRIAPLCGDLTREPDVSLDAIQRKEVASFVMSLIGKLPSRMCAIARMHWIDEMSCREIAQILELSRKTVENQVTRARRAIRADARHFGLSPLPGR